jgi:hypothetical protein
MADPDGNQPWISAGMVRRADYMVPLDGHRHSVYLYDPRLALSGYFQINGYFSDQFKRDVRERPIPSGVSFLQSSFGRVELGFTEVRTESPDAKYVLDISPGGTNVVMWAHGGNWPIEHTPTARGFVKVSWADGTCEEIKGPAALSPFLVFGVLIPPVFFKQVLCRSKKLRRFTDFVRHANLPFLAFLDEVSLGGMFMMLLHLTLVSVIGATIYYNNSYRSPPALTSFDYFDTSEGFDIAGLIQATGAIGMMHLWLAILPTARTSLWGYLTGVSYERGIKYHRAVVWMAVAFIFLHFLLNYTYTDYHWYDTRYHFVGRAIPALGIYSMFAFGATVGFANDLIRRHIPYELFKLSHYMSYLGIALLILHVPQWPVVSIGFAPGLLMHGELLA